MIHLKPKKCGGGYEVAHDETAPIPPSLVKSVTETGNYGLADAARMQYPELALKEGEVPGPVMSRQVKRHPILQGKTQEIVLRVGRGRGRILHVPLVEPAVQQLDKTELALQEAFGHDDPAEGMETENGSDKYPPIKLPPRYFEKTDRASYEKVAGLFLQGLQGGHTADLETLEDFEEDCLAPPKEATLLFEQVMEETEDKQGIATPNVGEEDAMTSAEVGGPIKDAAESTAEGEGSALTDSEWDDSASAYGGGVRSAATGVAANTFQPAGRPKTKPAKTNGYCLFLRHRANQTGTKGSINELMRIFDKDYKMLPEHERQEWKARAKSDGAWKPSFNRSSDPGRFGRRTSTRMSPASSTAEPGSLKSSTNETSETRSVISETSTTTGTTINQEDGDDSDWF